MKMKIWGWLQPLFPSWIQTFFFCLDFREENRSLREEIQQLRAELEDKTVEAYEAKEMNGIYSAKLTKLERKFKKLRDEDEESYMEMTF